MIKQLLLLILAANLAQGVEEELCWEICFKVLLKLLESSSNKKTL
jgi:hypothetical protein